MTVATLAGTRVQCFSSREGEEGVYRLTAILANVASNYTLFRCLASWKRIFCSLTSLTGLAHDILNVGYRHCDYQPGFQQLACALASTANMPRQNGFITDEVHLAIGKTLAGINIGASRLQIIAANLLRGGGDRKQPGNTSNNHPLLHWHNEPLLLRSAPSAFNRYRPKRGQG